PGFQFRHRFRVPRDIRHDHLRVVRDTGRWVRIARRDTLDLVSEPQIGRKRCAHAVEARMMIDQDPAIHTMLSKGDELYTNKPYWMSQSCEKFFCPRQKTSPVALERHGRCPSDDSWDQNGSMAPPDNDPRDAICACIMEIRRSTSANCASNASR